MALTACSTLPLPPWRLFAAVAIVVLMDVIDTRVRSAEDVEELLELPVIGRIPEMKGGR